VDTFLVVDLEKDVLRLQIAVSNPGLVRRAECPGNWV